MRDVCLSRLSQTASCAAVTPGNAKQSRFLSADPEKGSFRPGCTKHTHYPVFPCAARQLTLLPRVTVVARFATAVRDECLLPGVTARW
jgi:hypothetical protein